MSLQNNFGSLSVEYNVARKGYPPQVFEHLQSIVEKDKSRLLDVGCGTGISTRQLKEYGFEVSGADKDTEMIRVAKEIDPSIPYILAVTDQLPFEDGSFDIVTAFTAFHWFNNEESLLEIKRVLKPEGIFFVALKTNRKDENPELKAGYFSILKKYAGENFDTTKNHYDKTYLKNVGFSNISERVFPVDEKYTLEEALTLIRSLSLWNLVLEEDKPQMLEELKTLYERNLVEGFVVRQREISVITATK